jgi:hypothetical protein
MDLTKKALNIITLILTLFLVVYGFTKGYDTIELLVYDIYFATIIINSIINLFKEE